MRYTIKNEALEVEVDSVGAELVSVKNREGVDYLWDANPEYWGKHSPILFPFVGRLKNFKYSYKGKEYESLPHGFAKLMEFEKLESSEEEIWFELRDNEESYKVYPFHFSLKIGYKLVKNKIEVMWKVENLAPEENMYFSIGAHPGFFCPFAGEGKDKDGYSLEFETEKEELTYYFANYDTGLVIDEEHTLKLENKRVRVNDEFFDESAYIFQDNQVKAVSILTPSGKKYVEVRFDMPILAIWSQEKKKAPFICLEPWYGRCDGEWFNGTLEEREYSNTLKAGEVFENRYTIELF